MNLHDAPDDPRDAHLLTALRHAPDRDAVPPREVSERILTAARASVRPCHARCAPWWQRLSAWLMQPRVAASFGTLAVASLVGVMWSTREPPAAEFVPPPAAAERLQPSSAPASVAPSQADAAKPDAPRPQDTAAITGSTVTRQARPQSAPAARAQQAPAKDADKAAARTESRQRAAAEAPAAITEKAATASAPPFAVAAPAPPAADAAAPSGATERPSARASESRFLERRREGAPASTASDAIGMSLAAKANAAADPLARWDAVLGASVSDSVRWRIGERPPIAHRDAQALWWSALRRATAGAWQPQARASLPPSPWLAWEVSAQSAATLYLTDDALIICAADAAACWRAPVTAAQREAWSTEVARW